MVVVKNSLLFVTALALLPSGDAIGRDGPRSPNWDATLAVQTAAVPETRQQLSELFELLREADSAALNRRLDGLIRGGALAPPVRDSVLFQFAVGLADFDEVDEDVLSRLRSVEPRVLVPHQERPGLGVPLFNISGAAEGVYQLGLRREARAQALQVMAGPPDEWVAAYLQASRAQRLGFAESLYGAESEALAGILGAALSQLPARPELTPVAGRAALLLGDGTALTQVVRLGGGSELARILEAAGLTLSADDALHLLQSAVAGAPAANAALAIAQIYPWLESRPEATDLLFDALADDALGASAALALAKVDDGGIRARLQEVAAGDGPAAARAQSALQVDVQRGSRRP